MFDHMRARLSLLKINLIISGRRLDWMDYLSIFIFRSVDYHPVA